MDRATADELYQLAAHARKTGMDRALAWLMRAMTEERPKRPRGIKARLPKGGHFWLDPERIRED